MCVPLDCEEEEARNIFLIVIIALAQKHTAADVELIHVLGG